MTGELVLMLGALVIGLVALALSPLVRAICWDSLVHPRYRCLWERRGNHFRELKAGVDYPTEG